MGMGVLFALAAGMMWGLVFVGPLMLPEYPAALQSFGRYVAFGLMAIPLAWLDRRELARLQRADWLEALKLSAIGNVLYYLFLASAIQRAGGALPTMIIGTLPVVIAVSSNVRDRQRDGMLPWAALMPSLLVIAAGIACVSQAELAALANQNEGLRTRYASGAVLAVGAVACWTWYPLRNADWLRHHPGRAPRAWATAQGLMVLPMALLGYAGFWLWEVSVDTGTATSGVGFPMPFGPRPWAFVGLMAAIGLCSSWIGTLCWNQASKRLPTSLVGQLIVFETLAALAYAFAWHRRWPAPLVLLGVVLLVAGVLWAVRIKPIKGQDKGEKKPSSMAG